MAQHNAGIKDKSLSLYQEESFDRDSWFEIAAADYKELIDGYDFPKLLSSGNDSISLLDLGCGTGKFPSMLSKIVHDTSEIKYSYLDPSDYSLEECRKNLRAPFTPANSYQCYFENMRSFIEAGNYFNVIWSIQSLYCADQKQIEQTIKSALEYLSADGTFCIYLASSQSSYIQIQNIYHDEFCTASDSPYLNADMLERHLKNIECDYDIHKFSFNHSIPISRDGLLQNYLNQCALADLSLDDWLGNERASKWLGQYKCGESYEIPQNVWFFEIKNV